MLCLYVFCSAYLVSFYFLCAYIILLSIYIVSGPSGLTVTCPMVVCGFNHTMNSWFIMAATRPHPSHHSISAMTIVARLKEKIIYLLIYLELFCAVCCV